jgi:hypothetical protein
MSKREEQAKAAFLTDYRTLCEKHGMMVIRVESEADTYWAFSAAKLDRPVLDIAIQEMLMEPVRSIVHEDE